MSSNDGKGIRFSFLMENRAGDAGIVAEHGLSIYIEADGMRLLFDAGASDLFIGNAKRMGVELADVDAAVVSHGHYDHTGGFPAFCRLNDRAPIYVHRNAFRESYVLRDGKLWGDDDGIRWSDEQRAELEKRLILTDGPVMISDDICVTGTIEQEAGFVPAERFYYRDDDGRITEDDMSHEQCLVIRQPEGLYVFSGCSHTGVISAINTALRIFPQERIAVLVAGMHLYKASEEERLQVVGEIAEHAPDRVMPVHCTGIDAICDLRSRLGEGCVVASAGDSFGVCGERYE